jgi:hypothetical protein
LGFEEVFPHQTLIRDGDFLDSLLSERADPPDIVGEKSLK